MMMIVIMLMVVVPDDSVSGDDDGVSGDNNDDDDDGVSDNDKMKPSHSSSRRSARCCGTRQDLATRSRRAGVQKFSSTGISTKSNSQLRLITMRRIFLFRACVRHQEQNILNQL